MTRPKKIRISPYTFKVIQHDELAEKVGLNGMCAEDTQEIYMGTDMGFEVERETLLHEGLHAAWGQTTLNKLYTDEEEENILWTLTPRLLALLRENPKLVEWLMEKG